MKKIELKNKLVELCLKETDIKVKPNDNLKAAGVDSLALVSLIVAIEEAFEISPAKLSGWVQKHYLHHGVEASPELCHFTVTYCGRDMYVLASEIEKVAFYVLSHGRKNVIEADIKTAAVPAVEYDAFAFTNAITERRRGDALDILADLKFRRVEPVFVLSEVSRVVCDLAMVGALGASGQTSAEISAALKMHEYRVGLYLRQASKVPPERLAQAVDACREADAAMKGGVGASAGYGVIEKLICSL